MKNNQKHKLEEQIDQETAPTQEHVEQETQKEELSDIEQCQGELAEMKDKYLRQVAEFDNFRKRNAKERLELIQTAGKEVIMELLEVLDDMDRAVAQMEISNDLEQIKSGTILVFNKFRKTLENKGLKTMETLNHEFDVEYHEAITEIPAPSEAMQGKVMDELQKGYFLNDKIIRHAKVVVGK
ncbi:MAG TPA: nucleotide exchange factor GrpE [Edaphocola sp.]|nr:nucleotide exchange factor GrpE [Edaphocola sp.]